MAFAEDTESFITPVLEIRQHNDFDPDTLANDIAVLVLETPVNLTAYPNIKPACLPYVSTNLEFVGKQAIVSGWGRVGSGLHFTGDLMEVDVEVYGKTNCGNRTSSMSSDMFCAGNLDGGKDSCLGDYGGPLVSKDANNNGALTLIGVAGWSDVGCGLPGFPGVYSDVPYFVQNGWLESQLTDLNTCQPPDKTTSSCIMPKSQPKLRVLASIKKVPTQEDCRLKCLAKPDCDYWAWKSASRVSRRRCRLYDLKYRTYNNWVAGPRDCS